MSESVLIFRPGSFGDHILSLPCLHLIAARFPNARRILLTNLPFHQKAPPAAAILQHSGLVNNILEFESGISRRPWELRPLARRIRATQARILVHLSAWPLDCFLPGHVAFFWLCGIRRFIGLPFAGRARHLLLGSNFFESEASRLARSIIELGDAQLGSALSWNLRLTEQETRFARERLAFFEGAPLFAISIASSTKAKDWGLKHWQATMVLLRKAFPHQGLVVLGAAQDRADSHVLLSHWKGCSLNLCGESTPRETAAVLTHCEIFFGVDSAPMHLAASLGVSCVIVFSPLTPPGVWFPQGRIHEVLYPDNGEGLLSIKPDDVVEAAFRAYRRSHSYIGGNFADNSTQSVP